jgi:hypothetical protein
LVTGTGLAQGYYLLGIIMTHHSSRPMKYFASIPMTDNHFQSLSALYHRTMGLMQKMKPAMIVSATTILLMLLNEILAS